MLPNAFLRSSHAKKQFFRFLLQSATIDCNVNVCSWQPSAGFALFWWDEIRSLLMAKLETRDERIDVKSL